MSRPSSFRDVVVGTPCWTGAGLGDGLVVEAETPGDGEGLVVLGGTACPEVPFPVLEVLVALAAGAWDPVPEELVVLEVLVVVVSPDGGGEVGFEVLDWLLLSLIGPSLTPGVVVVVVLVVLVPVPSELPPSCWSAPLLGGAVVFVALPGCAGPAPDPVLLPVLGAVVLTAVVPFPSVALVPMELHAASVPLHAVVLVVLAVAVSFPAVLLAPIVELQAASVLLHAVLLVVLATGGLGGSGWCGGVVSSWSTAAMTYVPCLLVMQRRDVLLLKFPSCVQPSASEAAATKPPATTRRHSRSLLRST